MQLSINARSQDGKLVIEGVADAKSPFEVYDLEVGVFAGSGGSITHIGAKRCRSQIGKPCVVEVDLSGLEPNTHILVVSKILAGPNYVVTEISSISRDFRDSGIRIRREGSLTHLAAYANGETGGMSGQIYTPRGQTSVDGSYSYTTHYPVLSGHVSTGDSFGVVSVVSSFVAMFGDVKDPGKFPGATIVSIDTSDQTGAANFIELVDSYSVMCDGDEYTINGPTHAFIPRECGKVAVNTDVTVDFEVFMVTRDLKLFHVCTVPSNYVCTAPWYQERKPVVNESVIALLMIAALAAGFLYFATSARGPKKQTRTPRSPSRPTSGAPIIRSPGTRLGGR